MRTRSPATAVSLALALLITVVPAAPAMANSHPVIGEIRIDQPSTDDDEYFEVVAEPGTSLDGFTYLVIGDGTGGSGVIEAVVDLTGQTVSSSGFFVVAESTFTLGTADLVTDLNFENSDNVTHLLVTGFTGTDGDDLDTDDDGTLDTTPWTGITDLVALVEEENPPSSTEFHYGPPSVGPDGSFVPGLAFRCDGGWTIGGFDPADGDDTPGAANACDSPPATELALNEFVANHAGTDTHEYVELFGTPDTDFSALTIVEIEGDGTGSGVVDGVFPVGTTDADGIWFTGLLENQIENGSLTLLLVEGFSGTEGSDLDTDDDGTLDSMPWTAVVDAVAVADGGADDHTYATTVLAGGFDGISFTPGGASRIPDGSGDWVRNDFDGAGLPGFSGTPDVGEAYNTPDATNEAVPGLLPPAVINEFSASTTGTDVEYVEINGDPNTDYSAYTILEIEGDSGSNEGTVDEVITVGTTDSSGFSLASLPANALENGTITLLLVEGFTGTNGQDLDTNDDGVFDVTPWTAIADAVAVHDGDGGDLTYGIPVLGPNYDGVSAFAPGGASRIPDGTDTDTAADWVRNDFDLAGIPGYTGTIGEGEAYNTPGEPNAVYTPPAEACGDPFTPIHTIQGSGSASPLAGTEVATEGVVVGDFQEAEGDSNGLNGFFVQDPTGDGDTATSDGVFVYAPGGTDVSVGDAVRVRGGVSEFFDLTQISVGQIWICSSGNPLPTPTALTLPVASLADFEAYEAMYVTFPQDLTISEFFNFDRFGEIVLTAGRQYQPTALYDAGTPEATALAAANALGRITLDDGRDNQNPDPAIHPNGMEFDLTNRFRGGDLVTDVTGVMHYAFGLYRIQPTQGADHTATNPRTASPEDVGGRLTVASFNVLNYFSTIDTGAWICGPSGDMECRGADTAEEFERQRDKIFAALAAIDADVVGLMEIENAQFAVEDLVEGLNDVVGAGTYAAIDALPMGTDAISVALIYKPATVTPAGSHAILDDPGFLDPLDTGEDRNRPALAQTFMENATGELFTTVVNHLKSKGSACGPGDDDPVQGNCNLTRTVSAQVLMDWIATDPTGSGDRDVLLVGDYNAYDEEDPIDAILSGPDDTIGTGDDYTDLLLAFEGEMAYTYVFDGQLGYLDYGLASATLASQVTGATAWHINADEPDILDYDMTFKKDAQDALYEPNAYRSSDHDPVIVGLDLVPHEFGGFEPPIMDENTAKAGQAVPVKFSLGGFFGYDIFFEDPYWRSCAGPETFDASWIGGGLSYDWDTGEYVLVLKTDKDWEGGCLDLVLELADGTVHTARFEFR